MGFIENHYYYKTKDGKGYFDLKHPISPSDADKYEVITKKEFDKATYVAPYEPTEEEVAKQEKVARINELKGLLKDTDYQAIKYAEGWITKTEYAEIKTQRQAWRDEINQLQTELEGNEETVEEVVDEELNEEAVEETESENE